MTLFMEACFKSRFLPLRWLTLCQDVIKSANTTKESFWWSVCPFCHLQWGLNTVGLYLASLGSSLPYSVVERVLRCLVGLHTPSRVFPSLVPSHLLLHWNTGSESQSEKMRYFPRRRIFLFLFCCSASLQVLLGGKQKCSFHSKKRVQHQVKPKPGSSEGLVWLQQIGGCFLSSLY